MPEVASTSRCREHVNPKKGHTDVAVVAQLAASVQDVPSDDKCLCQNGVLQKKTTKCDPEARLASLATVVVVPGKGHSDAK